MAAESVVRMAEEQEPVKRGRMPKHRPTIADIARRAGVSKVAVSYALNDRPGVSPATRASIKAIAQEIGWRPNSAARALTGPAPTPSASRCVGPPGCSAWSRSSWS